jgi:predicted nucleic acid-binding protein
VTTLLDTGPLVAAIDRSDTHHARCAALLESAERPLLIPTTVIVEVCWLVEERPDIEAAFLESITAGEFEHVLCVPKTSSTSCDQAVFVDQATDASLFPDAILLKIDKFGPRLQRCGTVQGAVRPVLIVMGLVLAQDPPQMGLGPDEGAVQKLAAASLDPAFGDRVHAASARYRARSGSRHGRGPRRMRP